MRLGVPICEDIWGPEPVECISETGGEILLVPNGSPYRRSVIDERLNVAVARVKDAGLPLVYVNQVGGQDELVFEGASFVLNTDLTFGAQLPAFREAVATVVFERTADGWRCSRRPQCAGWRPATRPTMRPACWACATMWTRTAFPASSSACPAASTPRCARRWPSMRWAPSGCAA